MELPWTSLCQKVTLKPFTRISSEKTVPTSDHCVYGVFNFPSRGFISAPWSACLRSQWPLWVWWCCFSSSLSPSAALYKCVDSQVQAGQRVSQTLSSTKKNHQNKTSTVSWRKDLHRSHWSFSLRTKSKFLHSCTGSFFYCFFCCYFFGVA